MLYSFINLLPVLWQFKQNATAQHIHTQTILQPYWDKFPDLSAKDRKRMHGYPALFIGFFAEIWVVLLKRELSDKERKRLVLFAGSACLYDDFFDEGDVSVEALREMYLRPHHYEAQNDKERLFVWLMQDVYKTMENTDIALRQGFEDTFLKFWEAQVHSQQQARQASLTQEEIWQISEKKGGYAMLLSRYLLDSPLPTGEDETIFRIGAWFQLLDDTVDIDKDWQNKVQTLITTTTDINIVAQKIYTETHRVSQRIAQLPYPKRAKRQVSFRFFILSASGYIHLKRLKKLQRTTGNVFRLDQYTHQQILWVESRWSNLWIALPYLLTRFRS
jgi:hypothetical protein